MKFVADFHIHSHFSIATSKDLLPEYLDYWARLKGIKVVGTGDFTHPGWLAELKEKLEPAEEGLFRLKPELRNDPRLQTPFVQDNDVRFMLTAEISSIYKKDGRVRKVHNVLFAPDFQTVEKMQKRLSRIGNITSDGRPILGLDSRDLLEIALNCSERIFFVPAHIWTPWFSALGSKSGFDSIEACYGDLTPFIHAVETGLSSDPPMNWMCRFLDRYTLISNSDAHSPEKLGREANLLDTDLSYSGITAALKPSGPVAMLGTIEFFPQEGKYHYDGHRKCGICWDPAETARNKGLCPVCGKNVTVGVMNRVAQLADRTDSSEFGGKKEYYSLIPLKEILSEILNAGAHSRQVQQMYQSLLQKAGSEFNILLHLPPEDLRHIGNEFLVEGIRRMRAREVFISEGYDGEYGRVNVFGEYPRLKQQALFAVGEPLNDHAYGSPASSGFDVKHHVSVTKAAEKELLRGTRDIPVASAIPEVNSEQKQAIEHFEGPAFVRAGPGAGKTHVLTHRIVYLVKQRNIPAGSILAVTFTNKAAGEMRTRLERLLDHQTAGAPTLCTFHSLGLQILSNHRKSVSSSEEPAILDEDEKAWFLKEHFGWPAREVKKFSESFSSVKQNLTSPEDIADEEISGPFIRYQNLLETYHLLDYDDLLYLPVLLLRQESDLLLSVRNRYRWILVDEFQDINHAQYQLLRLLMPDRHSNLFAIGDPNQAIYGFRGADVRYLERFLSDYPDTRLFRLSRSYRCSGHILRASGNILPDETFLEGVREGVKLSVSGHTSDKSEAEFVARTIEKLMGGLRFFSMDSDITRGEGDEEITSLSDFGILCRIHQQIPAVEKALRDHGIPFQATAEQPLLCRASFRPLKFLIAHLLFPGNTWFSTQVSTLLPEAFSLSSLPEADLRSASLDSIKSVIGRYLQHAPSGLSADDALSFTGRLDSFRTKDDLRHALMLGDSLDEMTFSTEKVSLLTLHASKGLEFKCVFIIGCEDGLLPYGLFSGHVSDPDEERRLFYVGITRAATYLYLSHAHHRVLHGRSYQLARSPYLDQIERELIEFVKDKHRGKLRKDQDQLSLF